jgi:hypothetical protein
MRYVKIASRSKTNITDMFTLGVSTSRGTDKIGQFGSGSLMGTLVWMRKYGKSPTFMINGQKVVFKIQQVPKGDGVPFNQVLICYDGKRHPLSVALEYGELDWKDATMGIREWISNAIDAGQPVNEIITIVDRIEATDDEVAVFLPYTDEAKEYADNIGKYFLHYSGRHNEQFLTKDSVSKCRIYRRGVFMRELDLNSIWDYNLDFEINECRTGSSDTMIYRCISRLYAYGDEEQFEALIPYVLSRADVLEVTEQTDLYMYWTEKEVWKKKIGELAVCADTFMIANCTPVLGRWFKRIKQNVPELCGLKNMTEAELNGYTIRESTTDEVRVFNDLCNLIESVGLSRGKARPSLHIFETPDDKMPTFGGLCDYARSQVLCWGKVTDYSRVIVHELCHHYSEGDDYSYEFEKFSHQLTAAMYEAFLK